MKCDFGLATHYLEEAERLCDRVAIIVIGHIVALDTVDGLRSGPQQKTFIEVALVDSDGQQEKKRLDCDNGMEAAIQRLLVDTNGRRVLAVNTLRLSLEESLSS